MSTDGNEFKKVEWHGDQWEPSDDDDADGMPVRPCGPGLSAEDLELLTLAARALGAERVEVVASEAWLNLHFADGTTMWNWNPLLHSDDTFNLQVRLRMTVEVDAAWSYAWYKLRKKHTQESHVSQSPEVATRRAVTRAAAEISKQRS